MELQLHSHRWQRHQTDWAVAAASGFAAGAVLMVLELIWATVMSTSGPWRISQLVAALVLGPQTLQGSSGSFNLWIVTVALATHYVLGIVFGMVLGFIGAGFRYDTSPRAMAILGLVFGAALYFVDFHLIASYFPWLVELRGWANFVAHLIFGITASLLYWMLASRRARPQRSP
jgi:hypothetical protein